MNNIGANQILKVVCLQWVTDGGGAEVLNATSHICKAGEWTEGISP